MKAAVVRSGAPAPKYEDFEEPALAAGEELVHVTASALSHVTRSRASGQHYSSAGQFPFVAGVDGVGRLPDGRRVYFMLPRAPWGGMAERTVVRSAQLVTLPRGLDDVTAAAMANPGMSSWAALVERARLKPGETVLVNGATGIAGRLAVQIARRLGAGKVVATGRSIEALRDVAALGADVTIPLTADTAALEEGLKAQFSEGVAVVLDYLWGQSAELILIAAAKAAPEAVPVRFVHIGSSSGSDITLPSAVLRASAIELMGSGFGSIAPDRFLAAIEAVFEAAVPAGFQIAARSVDLSAVASAWTQPDDSRRVVFTVAASHQA